jgi:predicted acetyltransferase
MPEPNFSLEVPSLARLPAYMEALARGWSPNNIRDVSAEQLEAIRVDPPRFVASLLEQSGTIRMPNGSEVPKLPSRMRWMWDGEFCGSIGLRWQPGTDALPEYVLGHIGFAVVPWKRGRGYSARALRLMLPEARAVGLARIELTTEPGNIASQRTIESNGGRLVSEFVNPLYGPQPKLRYVIDLANDHSSRH